MGIELLDIVIENFGTIEHVKLTLNQPGMILITGLNKDAPKADSNGAGKSLLLDAICWCLWGKTVRGLTGDEVVRRQLGKDCCVTLNIRNRDTTYSILRHRKDTRVDKPNDLRLFINGIEKGKKMKNLQEVVDNIIGFDFDTFCAMMPGAGISVAALTDSKIKELLEKLLQTEQLSYAYSAVRDRFKSVDSGLKTQDAALEHSKRQLASLETEVVQLRELERKFLEQKASNVEARLQRISAYSSDILACDTELQRLPTLRSDITKFKSEVVELQNQIQAVEKPHAARIKLLDAEIQNHEQSIRLIDHDRASRKAKIQSLMRLEGECPICGNLVTKEHVQSCIDSLNAQTQSEASNYKFLTERVEAARTSRNKEVTLAAKQIAELKDLIAMKQSAIAALEKTVDQVLAQEKIKSKLEVELARERELLSKAQAEEYDFTHIFSTKVDKVKQLVQEVCQCLTAKRKLENEYKLCSFWVDGFSPAGLRSYMLDYITPILNDRASYYSEVLTGGEMKVTFSTKTALKSGAEKDKFQILVEQKHGGNIYAATSKGEKARADLVIAMALGDLATLRTARQLSWRFLDEPFENIDDAGNEAVVQLLNDQKSRYGTVFVITHKPALKQLFSKRITVIKENGVSRLEHEGVLK